MRGDETLLQNEKASKRSNVLDLTNCDKEPIHIPGAIQPHGVLFILDGPEFRITHVSRNASVHLKVDPVSFIGRSLFDFLDPAQKKGLDEKLKQTELTKFNPYVITFLIQGEPFHFDGIVHRHRGLLFLEIEPSKPRVGFEYANFYHLAKESVQRLRASTGLASLFESVVSEVRRITGFDRVLIYKFDDQWNGAVVAEGISSGVESYLDLHFPASDIPKQARDLYYLNHLRVIPTVNYESSPLIPSPFYDKTGEPIDLSLSTLRSVSPIHLEYLRNMRVTASMSVSIMRKNQLWGLISCSHESGPLFVPYDVRAICEFLCETLSALLPLHENQEDVDYRFKLARTQGALLNGMAQADDFIQGLLRNPDEYLEIANATGGAVYFGGAFHVIGDCPSDAALGKIVKWLSQQKIDDVFSTTSLPTLFPEADEFKDKACGLMAFSITKSQASYFIWFRPEVVQTVNWGGDPNKTVHYGPSQTLHPRKSFELWKEVVRRKSLPWREEEKQAIGTLRTSIIDIVLQRVEKITKLNVELERSNSELDSFAYAASHDLKEPLRGVHNYVGLMLREEGDRLSEESRTRMQTVLRLTQRSEDLINSLLHYSQIGRADLLKRKTDLNEVVKNALEALKIRIDEGKVEILIPRPLPTIVCDRVQITEVFTNLISNAIKYNSRDQKVVEIGFKDSGPTFYVKDNGIGIDPVHRVAIFKIFKRLHAKDRFGGGTGTGLTIAKKVIERHGGVIWLESDVGIGTTFYFSLRDVRADAE